MTGSVVQRESFSGRMAVGARGTGSGPGGCGGQRPAGAGLGSSGAVLPLRGKCQSFVGTIDKGLALCYTWGRIGQGSTSTEGGENVSIFGGQQAHNGNGLESISALCGGFGQLLLEWQ